MASERLSMTKAKVGPMGLQFNQLRINYRQPLQERQRNHETIGNVPSSNQFKEEMAHTTAEKTSDKINENIEGKR